MSTLKPPKAWKSFDEQLAQLKARGLRINDDKKALGYLKAIGYYRLSGYLYSFRQLDPNNAMCRLDDFIPDTNFDDVRQLYVFDKKLRQLALDALERIEIALRVNISYSIGRYDPLAHTHQQYFDPAFDHQSWLARYQDILQRESKTSFIKHHMQNYTDLPVWVGCEVWDFGAMSKLYKGLIVKDKDIIAKIYHLPSGAHLETHLHAFNFIRNISAHHARLWNKPITFKARLKGMGIEWQKLDERKPFLYFCLMKRMLDIICPDSTWGQRFLAVLDEFPTVKNGAVSLEHMGMIASQKNWQLWQ